MSIYTKAYKIAKDNLDKLVGPLGIYAGPKRHRQYWARDSFITSFGFSSLGNYYVVKKNLNTFLKYQRKDGHIPARVEENFHTLTLLGINLLRGKPKAKHRQSQPWANDVVDSNSWFLVSAANYIKSANDKKWFSGKRKQIELVANWLIGRIRSNGLLWEGYTGNWSDHNLRKGHILYNNVLAWYALTEIGQYLGDRYVFTAQSLKAAIMQNFWDERRGYFIDRIYKDKKYNYFYSDGNLLAVWFGFVDKTKAEKILGYIDSNRLSELPVPICHPRMDRLNDLANKLFFVMYRSDNIFTWWGCVSALARLAINDEKGAVSDLTKVAQKIVEYGTCHEVLTPNGKPVDLWFYKSEAGIAWTAGMYVYTFKELRSRELI